jgi:hypothetical protein
METHWPKLIVALCSIAIFNFTVYAADVKKPPTPKTEEVLRFKVKVTVQADEGIQNSVSSYLNRELRSLGDVDIVDNNPEWELRVLGGELHSIGGYKSGVVLSTIIITPFRGNFLSSAFKSCIGQQ